MRVTGWAAALTVVAWTGTGQVATGAYRLVSVEGRPLPALWQSATISDDGTLRTFWVEGQAVLREDSTYQVVLTLRTVGPGVYGTPVVTTMTGTWRQKDGGRLDIRPSRGGRAFWTLVGNRLSIRGRAAGTGTAKATNLGFEFERAADRVE